MAGETAGGGLLNKAQSARIRALIVGKMPDQLKLPFYLWTREAVAQLIAREHGITMSPTTVGRYLRAWDMSAQKPVRRAYEREDATIVRWLDEDYPAIVKEAKREKAAIYWGDEMGLRSDHVSGTCFAPTGQTPVVRATGQRFGCNMISAITNRGKLAFMVFEGRFQNPVFIAFMKRLLKQVKGRIYLIVDGHPVHRSAATRQFAAKNAKRLRLIRLPGYCPELNLTSCSTRTSRPTPGEKPSHERGRDDRRPAQPSPSPAEAASGHSKSVPGKACPLCRLIKITHYLAASSVTRLAHARPIPRTLRLPCPLQSGIVSAGLSRPVFPTGWCGGFRRF